MPRVVSGQEIETKLRVTDLHGLRSRLKQLRASVIIPRTHEFNTLYDTPENHLFRHGQMIRIRVERPGTRSGGSGPLHDSPGILTFKGPATRLHVLRKASGGPKIRKKLKIREEHEVTLESWQRMARILLALGMKPKFRYEKFRTTFKIPGVSPLSVELDQTPIGLFLELEGSVAAIDRGAVLLGYNSRDFINDTYGALFLDDCRRRGIKSADMLFRRAKKTP